jgi:uncharacterized protein YndB with AHSA1/START domain
MQRWLVSYADRAYRTAQERLTASARRFGIDVIRPWTRDELQQTEFYAAHRQVLDLQRGSGYWLWKPFIIDDTLRQMAPGDLLMYSDAGIEIAADLAPLFALCGEGRDIVLFANHYRKAANDCGTWTKRDCFALMDCDAPRFHDGPMVDASVVILEKTDRSLAFIRKWLSYACRPEVLTDAANIVALPNLPRFVEHRHDQSILSLLAIREGIELFRHPSQHGNHMKEAHLREPGEWTRFPYAPTGQFRNSQYGTLLNHHRGALGPVGLRVTVGRRIREQRETVFTAWTRNDLLASWSSPDYVVVAADADVRVGGSYFLDLEHTSPGVRQRHARFHGIYLTVDPPARLIFTAPADTEVAVTFREDECGTIVSLDHGWFRNEAVRERYHAFWESFLNHVTARLEGAAG